MKKQSSSINLFTPINAACITALTNEVKETIAFDFTEQQRPNFTTADLWNIRRQAKARLQRRYL